MGQTLTALIEFLERTGRRPIVIASHPRSGTHLLLDALRMNFPECAPNKRRGEALHRLYINLDTVERIDVATAIRVAGRSRCPLFKTHAMSNFRHTSLQAHACIEDSEAAAWFKKNATFLYSYRDGREALCSTQNMMRSYAPEARVCFSRFIRQFEHGLPRPALWSRHVRGWMRNACVYCVAMEELLRFPEEVLKGIGDHLQLGRPARWRLPSRPINIQQRLSRLFSRRPASTAILSTRPDSGWRSVFQEEDRHFFARHAGSLLVKLGYEESSDWLDPANDQLPSSPAGFWSHVPVGC
jgi:hypothetical protein